MPGLKANIDQRGVNEILCNLEIRGITDGMAGGRQLIQSGRRKLGKKRRIARFESDEVAQDPVMDQVVVCDNDFM